jgi:hypothetical protein
MFGLMRAPSFYVAMVAGVTVLVAVLWNSMVASDRGVRVVTALDIIDWRL